MLDRKLSFYFILGASVEISVLCYQVLQKAGGLVWVLLFPLVIEQATFVNKKVFSLRLAGNKISR